MSTPTNDDITGLLADAIKADAGLAGIDAHVTLTAFPDESVLDCVRQLLASVCADIGPVARGEGGGSERDKLLDAARTAKRDALHLLHAAWAAEREAERLRGGR